MAQCLYFLIYFYVALMNCKVYTTPFEFCYILCFFKFTVHLARFVCNQFEIDEDTQGIGNEIFVWNCLQTFPVIFTSVVFDLFYLGFLTLDHIKLIAWTEYLKYYHWEKQQPQPPLFLHYLIQLLFHD